MRETSFLCDKMYTASSCFGIWHDKYELRLYSSVLNILQHNCKLRAPSRTSSRIVRLHSTCSCSYRFSEKCKSRCSSTPCCTLHRWPNQSINRSKYIIAMCLESSRGNCSDPPNFITCSQTDSIDRRMKRASAANNVIYVYIILLESRDWSHCTNDPSAGSPTETLLRLLLPLSDKVYKTFC